jgi:Ca-activated chloride channel homolog
VLVLLTDGEDLEGDPVKAAEEAAKEGVRIYAIGIGSQEGVPIPLAKGGYKESGGSKVNTRLNFDALTKMAYATGGKAIVANPSGDAELKEVYKDIEKLKEIDLQSKVLTIHKERFQYLLLPAVILLAAEMLLSDKRRRVAGGGAGRFD